MPSRGNPNVPNKQRRIASRAKVQKRKSINKISKNPRGTAKSNVLHPTSGPLAPLSSKKARKVEKAREHSRKRAIEKAMEQEGEIQMTDAPKTTKSKAMKTSDEEMDISGIQKDNEEWLDAKVVRLSAKLDDLDVETILVDDTSPETGNRSLDGIELLLACF